VHSRFSLVAACLVLTAGAAAREYTILDVQSVPASGDASRAVLRVSPPAAPAETSCDILIAGAGMGGIGAALRAADLGASVCLTEETGWIGGQATSGGVSALDENKFIEFAGGTRAYYEFRDRIREHYRTRYRLAPAAAQMSNLNPGACYVSPLCFEPPVGAGVLDRMLARRGERIRLFRRTVIVSLELASGAIRSALAYRFDTGQFLRFRPRFVLDATELGDLLPLAGVPYVVGSEPRSETGEPHASERANAACVQSFTYPFAIEHRPGGEYRIPKPAGYEELRDAQHFSFRLNYPADLGWKGEVEYTMFGEDPPIPNNQSPRPFFGWRRLLARFNFAGPNAPNDVALVNWPRQDYARESILDRTPADAARILQTAKRVSLAFLYWLQNEVARDDGRGRGYPELALRTDLMGSADGLSKYPYTRESRRIRARERVGEQDIVDEYQPGPRARWYADSVGTGFYMVDIHPCGAGERGRMMMPRPFQIPMGTLVPREGPVNLLPAGKSIGVTHLANGAFRLHPVEWNIGEAAGAIAVLFNRRGKLPEPAEVQSVLAAAGVPLVWFDDVSPAHPAFKAIHRAAIRGIYPLGAADLHASPGAPVTRGEAARALAALFDEILPGAVPKRLDVPSSHPHAAAISAAIGKGWMATDHRNWFHPDLPFYWTDWREARFPRPIAPPPPGRSGPVTRAELAERLTAR
jgi:hypothetical protein